jgi:hypothetical protein
LFLGLAISGYAQSDKIKETANEKVEQLNAQIIKGNPKAALTEAQKSQIAEIHMERIQETRKLRKTGGSDEDLKAINHKYFKQIFSEVLTKEQRQANKEGKEK